VIQPHLPVRLPCYDFTPVTNPTLGILLQKVRVTTSGITSFHGVTGGVYKARERIHRCIADQRLLAIPPSCRRVAACNPNLERVYRLANLHRVASHCLAQCSTCRCIELNHMLHRLCGPPSIPLSFTLASILPRRDT